MGERISSSGNAMALGQRIATARKNVKKSRIELSIETNVDRSLISRIERGHFRTLSKSVQKICTYLHLDPGVGQGDVDLDSLMERVRTLCSRFPRLPAAIDAVLDAVESSDSLRDR